MILSPHEIVWLVRHVDTISADLGAPLQKWPDTPDPVTGHPHHILGAAVVLGESGGDTEAIARSADASSPNFGQRDHGLFQMSGRWNGDKIQALPDWRDPRVNVVLAKRLWDETQKAKGNGWAAWAVFNSRSFEKWLPDARMGALFPFPPPRPQRRVQVVVTVNGRISGDVVE